MAVRGKNRQFPTAYKLKAIKRVERGEGVLPDLCVEVLVAPTPLAKGALAATQSVAVWSDAVVFPK